MKQYASQESKGAAFWLIADHMCESMDNLGTSMGEHVGLIRIMGLTYEEITGESIDLENIDWVEQNEIDAQILRGGLPALYGEGFETNKEKYFDTYIHEFLRDEIKGMTSVTDIMQFRKFMKSVATRTGQLVNYAALAKDSDISQPTAKQWLSILVTAGMIELIQPFSHPKLTRVIDVPRMYFLDTGLCSYLTGSKSSRKLFKTWVVSEIIKQYYNKGMKPPLYHYRDKDGKEVDLMIKEEGTLQPIEIIDPTVKLKDKAKRFEGFSRKNIDVKEWKTIRNFDSYIV